MMSLIEMQILQIYNDERKLCMDLSLDNLKRMKVAKIEDIKNCEPLDGCIEEAVSICRRKVSKKSFMREIIRTAKRILKKADTESYIYDCMWCELFVSKMSDGNMLVRVEVASNMMFAYVITIPRYADLSANDLLVTCERCFEEVKKVFIEAGFEIKEPSINTHLYGEFRPFGSFHFVF